MKFVLAPDKFKGSLSGMEFCEAAETGIQMVFPKAEIIKKPLADGGDGTLEVIQEYLGAKTVKLRVSDPLFRKTEANYLYSEARKTAFIEMSEASGHRLLQAGELNCMETTTLGTGELVLDAIHKGAKEILLGIGGSATNDGGMGVAQALGYSFLDREGQKLAPIGKNLSMVHTIETPKDSPIDGIEFKIACDVNNPFYGPEGAAHIYAAQKGASTEDIKILDKGLAHFAKIVHKDMGIDLQQLPGAGAAGGLGGGAVAFLNGTLISGIDLVMELSEFDKALNGADWIITGEGKLDGQTLAGKTIAGVMEAAKRQELAVAAFCGAVTLTLKEQQAMGLAHATAILKDIQSLQAAKENAYDNLVFAIFNFCNLLKRGAPRTT